jgi:hypothetical protein
MMVHFPASQTTISFNASNDYHDHSRFRDFHGADTAYSQSSSAKTMQSRNRPRIPAVPTTEPPSLMYGVGPPTTVENHSPPSTPSKMKPFLCSSCRVHFAIESQVFSFMFCIGPAVGELNVEPVHTSVNSISRVAAELTAQNGPTKPGRIHCCREDHPTGAEGGTLREKCLLMVFFPQFRTVMCLCSLSNLIQPARSWPCVLTVVVV